MTSTLLGPISLPPPGRGYTWHVTARLLWEPRDLWVGVYWDRTRCRTDQGHQTASYGLVIGADIAAATEAGLDLNLPPRTVTGAHGTEATAELDPHLPSDAARADYERIVVITRETLIRAKQDIPDA